MSPDEPVPTKKHRPLWQEAILVVAVAMVLAVVIKALLVQAFYIPSASMEPGLVENDKIIVQKVSYWFGGGPERGDVVVFEDPGGWLPPAEAAGPTGVAELLSKVGLYPSGGHLVKRVIGVEGDTIVCCDEQGRIEVNGVPLDEEDYARPDPDGCYGPMPEVGACDWTAGPVPDGQVFVMGDNRDNSRDSSAHLCDERAECDDSPYVDVDGVVGRVFVLLWPGDRFGLVHRPDTFEDVPDAS
jgi:signal peptidase I